MKNLKNYIMTMKTNILTSVFFFLYFNLIAQNATEISPNAILVPRFADAAAVDLAIPNPINGMFVYRTDTQSFWYRNASAWVNLSSPVPTQWTNAGNNIYNTNTGNVGIGTTTPNAPLQFSNGLTNRKVVLYETGNNDHQYYGFGINAGALRYQTDATAADHVFYSGANESSSNELMRIKGNGNIGIGMNAPNAPLQFSNAFLNRKIVLYETFNNNHQYYGLGVSSNVLRYQTDATSADHVFFAAASATSSNELMRIKGTGSVGIGGSSNSDKLTVVGSSSSPFGVFASTAFNGAGIYGRIDGGTTKFAGVQGEYASSAAGIFGTAGVSGHNSSNIAGTGFRNQAATGPRVGVFGTTGATTGQYTFGLHGSMNSTDIRCGGVFADDFGIANAALAYYASNLTDYSVYGFGRAFQTGVAGGRQAYRLPEPNTQIGLGIYGGVMGGWIRGLVYGTHIKGEQYSLYVDGKTYVNEPIAELVSAAENNRTPAYALTTFGTDVYAKGKAKLENGTATIRFQSNFKSIISTNPEEIVITVSPSGKSKGIYIESQDENGFVVRENDGGDGTTNFSWIAIATRKDRDTPQHPSEVLAPDFDSKMDAVMYNDNNTDGKQKSIWWDGSRIRFDRPNNLENRGDGIDRSRKGVKE
jgi:hypothetical protein